MKHVGRPRPNVQADLPQRSFRRINIPGDGFCFWHAVLASRDVTRFESVDRNAAGYPTNHKLLGDEIKASQQLCEETCQLALQSCPGNLHPAITSVRYEHTVAPTDISWISGVLGISIRCTISEKARTYQKKRQNHTLRTYHRLTTVVLFFVSCMLVMKGMLGMSVGFVGFIYIIVILAIDAGPAFGSSIGDACGQ